MSSVQRLCFDSTAQLNPDVVLPQYDYQKTKPGIVHIGIGAFHRAHQAVFTEQAMNLSGGDWKIIGISMRSSSVAEQLNPQDGLFTVTQKQSGRQTSSLIGAIDSVLVAPQNIQACIDAIASSATQIVTITVTEKGYHFDFQQQHLNQLSDDIAHDIQHPSTPKSMPGLLVAACKVRIQQDPRAKLTVISCDNLPNNGEVVKKASVQLAALNDQALADWMAQHVSFCSSMVDRIVPAVTPQQRQQSIDRIGLLDNATVITEPFKQWVVQDNFATPRPDWKGAGVLFVDDIDVYERLKLRTLNATHSTLAYMGILLGYDWIHEAMSNPLLQVLCLKLMENETGATLEVPKGFDISAYRRQTIERFENSDIPYATHQVAMDGTLKLQQRIFAPLLQLVQQNAKLVRNNEQSVLVATFVCWLAFVEEKQDELQDPLAQIVQPLIKSNWAQPLNMLAELQTQTGISPDALMGSEWVREQVLAGVSTIDNQGVGAYLSQVLR